LEVTKDIIDVLENPYTRIPNDELAKVSDLMNSLFLKMIGAGPEQEAIIRKSQITKTLTSSC
jgi:septum formation inhibitor-activating ATPase MinD